MNVLSEYLKALLKRRYILLACVVSCGAASMMAFKFIPKKYKTSTVISVQTQFQNPLVRDFIPEPGDASSTIHHALNHAFVREIGKKYNLIKSTAPVFSGNGEGNVEEDMYNSYDLDLLLQRFEIMGAGTGSFLIGFSASDPLVSYHVVQDATAHIREVMQNERREQLDNLRAAIQTRIESLSLGKQSGVGPAEASRPDLLKSEVAHLEAELEALRLQYSDKHPKVTELRNRLNEMKKWSNRSMSNKDLASGSSLSNSKAGDGTSKELFQDLLKKYHYLEIVIALDRQNADGYVTVVQEPTVPHAALWPKRPIILLWGVTLGFLMGSILVFLIELNRETSLRGIIKSIFVVERSA